MITFTIPGNQMDLILLTLGGALMILVIVTMHETAALLKPKKKRGPWDKK